MESADRTIELLTKFVADKQNLVDTLVAKGETASMSDTFESLVQKAGNYIPKTYVFVDENGNEVTGVLVDEQTIFDATDNDVREGKVYAGDTGPSTGTKVIPTYHTTEGYILILAGKEFAIPDLGDLNKYEFTKLQALTCSWAGSVAESVATDRIAINDGVYAVNSTEQIATVLKDSENKAINLGVVNDSGSLYVLRYFTYKEIN